MYIIYNQKTRKEITNIYIQQLMAAHIIVDSKYCTNY